LVSAGVSARVAPEGSLARPWRISGWVLALAFVAVATSALCEPGVPLWRRTSHGRDRWRSRMSRRPMPNRNKKRRWTQSPLGQAWPWVLPAFYPLAVAAVSTVAVAGRSPAQAAVVIVLLIVVWSRGGSSGWSS